MNDHCLRQNIKWSTNIELKDK